MVELLITIVIAAILAAVAVPGMGVFVKNTARSTNINSLVSAFTLARSIAVKRNSAVTVCASGKGGVYTACNADPGKFDDGWIVFSDPDNDQTVDAGETIRRVYQPDIGSSTSLRGWVGTAKVNAVTYRGDGTPTNLLANTLFRYCDSRGASAAREIALSVTGQPQSAQGGVASCP